MGLFHALLILFAVLIPCTCGEYNTTATVQCICSSYTAMNSTWINATNNGCEYCEGICNDDICECLSESRCQEFYTLEVFFRNTVFVVSCIGFLICLCCVAYVMCMNNDLF